MRKPRHTQDGAIYHITHRTNNKELLLEDGETKKLFYEVLRQAKKKYDFFIYNMCIMGNHVHLLMEPSCQGNSQLKNITGWIFSMFARLYNHLHGRSGHFWADRFHSRIITDTAYLSQVNQYICENPVRADIVDNPLDFPFNASSLVWNHNTKHHNWEIFEDLPRYWKNQLLRLIQHYRQLRKNNAIITPITDDLGKPDHNHNLLSFGIDRRSLRGQRIPAKKRSREIYDKILMHTVPA